ncbi:hypothetical protein FQZ97_1263960 [compost metagenome]
MRPRPEFVQRAAGAGAAPAAAGAASPAGAPPEGGVVTNPMRVMPERRAEAMTLASVS